MLDYVRPCNRFMNRGVHLQTRVIVYDKLCSSSPMPMVVVLYRVCTGDCLSLIPHDISKTDAGRITKFYVPR